MNEESEEILRESIIKVLRKNMPHETHEDKAVRLIEGIKPYLEDGWVRVKDKEPPFDKSNQATRLIFIDTIENSRWIGHAFKTPDNEVRWYDELGDPVVGYEITHYFQYPAIPKENEAVIRSSDQGSFTESDNCNINFDQRRRESPQ